MMKRSNEEKGSAHGRLAWKCLLPVGVVCLFLAAGPAAGQERLVLENDSLALEWQHTADGYRLGRLSASDGKKLVHMSVPSGEYTLLFSPDKPDAVPDTAELGRKITHFPEPVYRYLTGKWQSNIGPVPMNTAGRSITFFPGGARRTPSGILFTHETDEALLEASWSLDPQYKSDIVVEISLKAKAAGYYSIATPSLAELPERELAWGMIPGYFQGSRINPDLIASYAYGEGIPPRPLVLRERTASTLSPLLSSKNGLTLAVIPKPGTGRDPWTGSENTHNEWRLGLSLMSRGGALSPTLYHPVLGEAGSYLKPGESRRFSFRYTLRHSDWYEVYTHAIYDIYRFSDVLALKDTRQSLTSRILSMLHYLRDDSTSMWSTRQYQGLEIGAQAYLGGVVGADKDAMKNSDYGAMWMLANITGDEVLKSTRLPYARNFKLTQQQTEAGFFKGAAVGQYYLWKSRKFTEEWGNYVEPVALTYYTMLDIGNILLFEPSDDSLKARLRMGADKLLEWQHADGHWEVAYDRDTARPLFTELRDLRPTFYGLLVAYRLLGDKKYLQAARKGAEWFIENAVEDGAFLGVCGDARFVPDFATGQSVQALLDLYELTKEERYLEAAVRTARFYTASVYTHPIPSREKKTVKDQVLEDWEISQVGLSFEHGGSLGSATGSGPILLASHAGMFVRMFAITGDSLFLDMARAAAWGRDAFVDPATSVASYYWRAMNAGPGPFPHHAWWQVGWITDYLISEISLRSGGKISFPRGFITPKVGPHQSYGFGEGEVFGNKAALYLPPELLTVSNERVDYMAALDTASGQLFMMLLNNDDAQQSVTVSLNEAGLARTGAGGPGRQAGDPVLLNSRGEKQATLNGGNSWELRIPAFGLNVIALKYRDGSGVQ